MINKVQNNVAPTPKQWEDPSPEGGSKFSALGLGVGNHTLSRKVFIETYGCPYVTVARDGTWHSEKSAWV